MCGDISQYVRAEIFFDERESDTNLENSSICMAYTKSPVPMHLYINNVSFKRLSMPG